MHNTDRKPQAPGKTGKITQVRQQTDWGDGFDQNPGSILRGARPKYDRECKKGSAPTNPFCPLIGG